MKGQDIFILLKLVSLQQQFAAEPRLVRADGGSPTHRPAAPPPGPSNDAYTARGLAAATGVSKTEVNASIRRSITAGMAMKDRKSGQPQANRRALVEFVTGGLKYVFPARPAEIARGVATGFAAPMLRGELRSLADVICIWPYAKGHERGQAIQPLFKSVAEAALEDARLYEYLALINAIRIGQPLEAGLAAKLFEGGMK